MTTESTGPSVIADERKHLPKKRTPPDELIMLSSESAMQKLVGASEGSNAIMTRSKNAQDQAGTNGDQVALGQGIKRKICEVDKQILIHRRQTDFYCWSQEKKKPHRFAHHQRPVIMAPVDEESVVDKVARILAGLATLPGHGQLFKDGYEEEEVFESDDAEDDDGEQIRSNKQASYKKQNLAGEANDAGLADHETSDKNQIIEHPLVMGSGDIYLDQNNNETGDLNHLDKNEEEAEYHDNNAGVEKVKRSARFSQRKKRTRRSQQVSQDEALNLMLSQRSASPVSISSTSGSNSHCGSSIHSLISDAPGDGGSSLNGVPATGFYQPRKKNLKKGPRNHACKFPGCDLKVSSTQALQKHMYLHTGMKPFKCLVESCDQAFARKDYMHTHIRNHHPDQTTLIEPNLRKSRRMI